MAPELVQFIFMIQVEKDHAVVLYQAACFAGVLKVLACFTAFQAPMIDNAVVPAADILFQAAVVETNHFPV
ncbi:MAG: hypothetical protein JRE63_00295 [Deltaproteobacteria bacterium]|jgi:hypothetical protein|nr:hypothetical protein [Deltaproteobacteria bacterium]